MDSEQYAIVQLIDGGIGILRSMGAHYSVVEFEELGHRWKIMVENDEFIIIDYINIGHKEI